MFRAIHPLRSSVNLLSSSVWKIYRNRSCELITMRYLSTTFPSLFLVKMISGGIWKIIIFADDKWTKKRRIKVFDLYPSFHQSLVVAIRCVVEVVVVIDFSFYFFFSFSLEKSPPVDRGRVPVDVFHGALGT